MSKRITTRTNITNKDFAITALQTAGMEFQDAGNNELHISSGALRGATINLATGEVSGDSDYHRKDTLGALRRNYGEVKFRHEAAKEGVQIQQRIVEKNGDIRLKCRMVAGA